MIDLTVAAIPFYFGTMAAENKWLSARADPADPKPAEYTRQDTLASLAMGVGSLVVPLVTHRLIRPLTPGRSKGGAALVATAAAAAVATTVADRVARRTELPDPSTNGDAPAADAHRAAAHRAGAHRAEGPNRERRRRLGRIARKVARVGGVTAVATGWVAAAAAFADRTQPARMWEKGRERDLGSGPLAWLVAVFGWDFIYYWNHRFMHEIRAMWALHVVHHSSEHYNLSTALRQPVADVLGLWVPYGLMARMGVRPSLIMQARGINLIYQYWIHTETIRSIGPGEQVLNTPSHHRVHHGANPQYIDRNHGSILIVWDKLFGTFEPEDEPVVYGLTKNIRTYDPTRIATHEYRDIIRDVADSTTWSDRLSYVLRDPGWAYEQHSKRALAGVA